MIQLKKLLRNLKLTIPLLLWSLFVTIVVIIMWRIFRNDIYNFFKISIVKQFNGYELDSGLAFFMPGILYGAIEGFVLNQIMTQNRRLHSAIDTLNARMFLEERDRRTSPLIHFIMFFISVLTTGMSMIYRYPSDEVAMYTIGTSVFLATFALMVAIELDNPFTGVWKLQDTAKIPRGWTTMTIRDIIENTVPHINNPMFDNTYMEKNEESLVERIS